VSDAPRYPNFAKDNIVALKHGADSERAIEARATEVRRHLFSAAPWLVDSSGEPVAAYLPEVARFLRAEAREALLHDHITALSESKGAGAVPQRVWELATAASNLASKLGDKLGLNPQALARLKLTAAGATSAEEALSDLQKRGAQIRAAAKARSAAAAAAQVAQEALDAHDGTEAPGGSDDDGR